MIENNQKSFSIHNPVTARCSHYRVMSIKKHENTETNKNTAK